MKKDFYIILFWLLLVKTLTAQSDWTKSFGLFSSPVIQTFDTASVSGPGYIIGGSHDYNTDNDIALIRTNSAGAHAWDKSIDLGGNDSTFCIKTLSDGSYVLAGNTVSGGNSDIFLMHTTGTGAVQWTKRITNSTSAERCFYVSPTNDGGFILTGAADSSSNVDLWVVKLTSGLTLDWARKVRGTFYDAGHCVKQTQDGGYIVAGTYGAAASDNQDALLMKLTSSGTISWTKRFAMDIGSTYKDEEFFDVVEMSDGKYVAAGYMSDFFDRDYCFVVKVTTGGTVVWGKSYEYGGTENPALGITRSPYAADKDSLVLFGLRTNIVYEMIKTDSAGVKKFAAEYNMSGNNPDMAWGLRWCPDNGIVFAHNAHASANFGLTKTKPDLTNCYWGTAKAVTTNTRTPTVIAVAAGIKGSAVTIANITASNTTFSQRCKDDCNGGSDCLNTLMPVDMLYFNASCEATENKNFVLVSWATASELNNDFFTIERSENGSDYEIIGTVKGAGTSSVQQEYSFKDFSEVFTEKNSTLYYQLKQTDFDGKYKYTGPVAVNTDCSNGVSIYPTLTNGMIFIRSEKKYLPCSIAICDAMGRKVFSENFPEGSLLEKVDLSFLPKGIYFFEATTLWKIFTGKIVLK